MMIKRAVILIIIGLWMIYVLEPFVRTDNLDGCVQTSPGVMDYSSCGFNNDDVYKLNGQWEFYRHAFLNLDSGEGSMQQHANASYMKVPASWSELFVFNKEKRLGYATYQLKLILPATEQTYGLGVTNIRTASCLYVDGVLLGESGVPGTSAASTVSANQPYTAYFDTNGSVVNVIVHVANYTYWRSGIAEPIYLGNADAIEKLVSRNERYDWAVIVSLVIMGLYYAGQGIQHRKETAAAFFLLAVFCLVTSLFVAVHGTKLMYDFVPALSYLSLLQLQNLSPQMAIWMLMGYTHYINPKRDSRLMFWLAGVCFVGFVLIVLVAGVPYSTFLTPLRMGMILLVALYVSFAMIRAIIQRITGSIYLLIALLGLSQFAVIYATSIMFAQEIYSQPPIGIFVFLVAQGLFLGARSQKALDKIRNLTVKLQRQSKEKDDFLMQTSQELRTPLQAMKHILRSMLQGVGGSLSPPQRKDLLLLEHTSNRLSFLMNDLFDYERMKDGSLELRRQSLELSALVEIVLDVFRQLRTNEGIILHNDVAPHQFLVWGDEDRVTQITYNLIEAAIHDLGEGQVRVTAALESQMVRIDIISSGQHAQTFQYAEQMGITISRMLIRLHEGELTVENQSVGNSRYVIRLPQSQTLQVIEAKDRMIELDDGPETQDNAALEPGWTQTAAREAETPYRILVVDEVVQGRALAGLLQAEGFAVLEARSGEDALRLLTEGTDFDLAIIDVLQPGMSGFSLCREIRLTHSLINLPILLMTGNSRMNETGLAAGANDLIRKPYEWEELIARVRTLVHLKRSAASLLDSEVAMLRAQIRPHFLFNAFNTIIWMSKRDAGRTSQLLRDLSNFLRGSFDFGSGESLVSLDDELALVRAYLSLEQARLGHRLHIVYEVDTLDLLIPPLVIQPLVENAIRHGLGLEIEELTIVIAVRQTEGEVEITVTDNGAGMSTEQIEIWNREHGLPYYGNGIGLSNVNRRMLRMYGRQLVIQAREDGGTIVSLRLYRR